MSNDYDHILTRLNLKAVLPSLAALVRLDEGARSLVARERFAVRLKTCSGVSTRLDFLDGEVEIDSDKSALSALELLFLSDRQLNNVFSGSGFALPLPVAGFSYLARMRTFSKLAKRLEQILDISPNQPVEPDLLVTHTDLLVGDFIPSAVAQLARFDAPSKRWLSPFTDALAQLEIAGGASSWLRLEKDSVVHGAGKAERLPDVIISFRDRHVALAAIHGELDSLAALGKGEMTVRGLIPLAEALDRVLERLGRLLERKV